jgi:hypothetical protein
MYQEKKEIKRMRNEVGRKLGVTTLKGDLIIPVSASPQPEKNVALLSDHFTSKLRRVKCLRILSAIESIPMRLSEQY